MDPYAVERVGEVRNIGRWWLVVINQEVVTDNRPLAALDWQPFDNNNGDTHPIRMSVVRLEQHVRRVLYFDATEIVETFVVDNVNVLIHSHVDAGVRDSRNHVVRHEAVPAVLGEDSVK